MDGQTIMRGLIERGLSPVQAAALAGHSMQESGGNPADVNPKEDAHGLLNWRLDRWQGLQDFAKARGLPATDPNAQMDFMVHELHGPEAKASAGFLAATDLPSASAALKPFIRFGDNSAGTRLANAQGILAQFQPQGQMAATPAAPVNPATMMAAATQNAGGQGVDPGIMAALKQIQVAPDAPAPHMQSLSIAPSIPVGLQRARELVATMQRNQ